MDPPKKSLSAEFRSLGLQSVAVDELLTEVAGHTSDVFRERLKGLPDEVGALIAAVISDRRRAGAEMPDSEETSRIIQAVSSRLKFSLSDDRADLAGRTVRLRLNRAALWFALQYANQGLASAQGPTRHDTPTPLLPPPLFPKK